MHCIVVFSTHDGFCLDLRAALRERDDVDVVVARSVEELLTHLQNQRVVALIGDVSLRELATERRQHLAAVTADMTVAAVDDGQEPPHEDWIHLADLDEAVTWLCDRLEEADDDAGFDTRPESASYFVGDTQGRAHEGAADAISTQSHGLVSHHTSEAERAETTPTRLLYVGPRDAFRRQLEEQSAEFGVAAAFADSPDQVALSNAADALDLAVFAVDEDALTTTRRAIRFLRHQQIGVPFEVALLRRSGRVMAPALARSLGADKLWQGPMAAAELLESVKPVTGKSEKVEVVILSAHMRRAQFVESALRREPVDLFVTGDVEEAVERVEASQPDIVVVDAGLEDGWKGEEGLVGQLRRLRQFGLTRFVRVVPAEQSELASNSGGIDDLLIEPLTRADVRRVIRRQAAQLAFGRLSCERDALTGVHTALVLGERLQQMLGHARQDDESVVLSAIDVDGMDTVNRRFGRVVGDAILRSLADALRIVVDNPRQIFRTSEDEFFVLQRTDNGDWSACRDRLDRALRVFETQTMRAADGRGAFATASAGAIVVPPARVSAELCLQKSLLVLDRAARTDRDGVLVAHLDPEALPEFAREHDRADEH